MPIYVDRSNAGSCIYLFNLFCGRPPSLVFDGTCLYIVFNNLVDAVKVFTVIHINIIFTEDRHIKAHNSTLVSNVVLTEHETPTLRSVYTINIDV